MFLLLFRSETVRESNSFEGGKTTQGNISLLVLSSKATSIACGQPTYSIYGSYKLETAKGFRQGYVAATQV
jgi:hypothetical protein